MKKVLFVTLLTVLCVGIALSQGGAGGRGGGMMGQAPAATGPIADLANAGIDAMNKNDAAFFEKNLSDTVVWFDEDGHAIAGKMAVTRFIGRSLLTGTKKVSITGLRVGDNWAGYVYTIEAGATKKTGTQTIVYKKVGNDWKIDMVHGAVAAPGHM